MKIKNFLLPIFLSVLLSATTSEQESINSDNQKNQSILISKSKRKLYLYESNITIDSADCSFGYGEFFSPSPKEIKRDKKTPEGEYFIIEKHQSQRYFYFIGINYPNSQDAIRGLERKLITQEQYEKIVEAEKKRITPPQYTTLGGNIGIHGEKNLGFFSLGPEINWTRGCISLRNEDIERIYENVEVGTKVSITD